MKKFFGEFKKFITRGNVLDMAVGVIVGGAFTAIVNGLSNNILRPIINWVLALILGQKGLSGAITMLSEAKLADGSVDLANSIYIDWGAFVSAIINFLLIALVLFIIVRTFNRVKENNERLKDGIFGDIPNKEERKEMRKLGIKITNRESVKAFLAQKEKEAQEKIEEEKRISEQKAKEERLLNPTTEDLLKDIKALLESKIK